MWTSTPVELGPRLRLRWSHPLWPNPAATATEIPISDPESPVDSHVGSTVSTLRIFIIGCCRAVFTVRSVASRITLQSGPTGMAVSGAEQPPRRRFSLLPFSWDAAPTRLSDSFHPLATPLLPGKSPEYDRRCAHDTRRESRSPALSPSNRV